MMPGDRVRTTCRCRSPQTGRRPGADRAPPGRAPHRHAEARPRAPGGPARRGARSSSPCGIRTAVTCGWLSRAARMLVPPSGARKLRPRAVTWLTLCQAGPGIRRRVQARVWALAQAEGWALRSCPGLRCAPTGAPCGQLGFLKVWGLGSEKEPRRPTWKLECLLKNYMFIESHM